MIVNLLTEHHLECLSLKGRCRGSSESTHVKMPHCWKSHATAQLSAEALQNYISVYAASTFCNSNVCFFREFQPSYKIRPTS